MANFFDQFDAPKPQDRRGERNFFDRFDPPSTTRNPRPRNAHPEFDPANVPGGIPGYDPATGLVDERAARVRAGTTGAGGDFGALTGGFVDGIPIAGPILRKAGNAAAAGMVAPFTGESFGDVYSEMQDRAALAEANSPWATTAGNIAGGVAGTLPMVMAAPTAFGAGGGSLLARTGASALSGAGVGGTDAAVRHEGDPDAIWNGITWGGMTGLAGPLAGDLIGSGIRGVSNWFRPNPAPGVPSGAQQAFARAAGDDGLDAASAAARLQQLGPDALPVDLGPNLTQQAARIAATPGDGQAILRNAMQARDAGADARLAAGLETYLGRAGVPSQMDAGIRASQKALSPLYDDALRGAKAVDTQAMADALDSAVVNLRGDAQAAARQVRQMLNISGTDVLDPNPATLLATRQAIDDMLGNPSMGGNASRIIGGIRQSVDDELTRVVPGIKQVDARFAELARQREALARGGQVFDGGKSAIRPAELAQEISEGALPRGQMVGPSAAPVRLRQGARAELDRIVGTNANDRVKLQRLVAGEGDWNPQKLATLFGEDRARGILDVLDRERVFAGTSHQVTKNAETARRLLAQGEVAPPQPGGGIGLMTTLGGLAGGGWGAAAAAGAKVADKGVSAIARALMESQQAAMNNGLARLLTSPVDEIAAVLISQEARGKALDPVTRALIDSVMRGPAVTNAQNLPVPAIPFAGAR